MSAAKVLTPYTQGRAGRRIRPLSLIFMLVYCAATGAMVALLPAQLLWLLGLPLMAAVPVVLWLLPDGGTIPSRLIASLLMWFIGATVIWPSYLSIDLPGLPWINPPRIIAAALLATVLWTYSTSSVMRREVADALNTIPSIRTAFWVFWAATLVSIAFSTSSGTFSLNRWISNQFYWTFLFALSAWLATREGVIDKTVKLLVWATIIVSVETIYEYHIREVPWLNHIPAFLTVDQTYLANVLKAQSRAGTDIYRAHGPFTVSLICAEYLAIVYPFLIHATIINRSWIGRALLSMGMLAAVTAMWMTNARSAMIGFFLAVFGYGGFAALRYWRRNRDSLLSISVLAMTGMAAIAFVALALTWPRLHNMTLGGGEHQPSSEARKAQWAMGEPKYLGHPLGHGPAQSGNALGYTNGAGQVTVDTYYLTLLLEYGLAGFAAFMIVFAGQFVYGLRLYFLATPGEEDLAGPLTIAIVNFVVIKSVLSSEFNIPLAFILLGFLFAIAWRQQQRTGQRVKPFWSSQGTPLRDDRGLAAA